jgi:uncharacterized protein YkwD
MWCGAHQEEVPVRIPTFRWRLAALVIAITLVLATTGCARVRARVAAAPSRAPAPSATEKSIINEVNRVRAAHGLRALSVSTTLMSKARFWSVWMAQGHCGRSGSIARICHSNLSAGINVPWAWLAENVGLASPRTNLNGVVVGFERSPAHLANILSARATSVGVGYAYAGDVVYVTEEFMQSR